MEAVSLGSQVEAVTVYTHGARVVRVAELARNGAGFPGALRLSGLPLSLRDDTVRVALTAVGSGVAPTATDLRVALDVPERDESLRPARTEELEQARLAVLQLEARVAQLQKELDRLGQLGLRARPDGAEGEPPRPSPLAARVALLELHQQRQRDVQAEWVEAQRELEEAVRHRDQLIDRDRRATSARQADEHELRKSVVVGLIGGDASADKVRVELEYQVPGARWAPAYTLRFDREMTGAGLAMRAVVAQRTGEDWTNAALTLSTAEMQRWTELPELAAVRVGRAQPVTARAGWRPPPPDTDDLYNDWDRSFRHKPAPPPPRAPRPRAKAVAAAEEVDEMLDFEAAAEFDDDMVTRAGFSALSEAEERVRGEEDKRLKEVEQRARLEAQAHMEMQRLQQEMPMRAMAKKSKASLFGGLFSGSAGGPPPQAAPAPSSAPMAPPPTDMLVAGAAPPPGILPSGIALPAEPSVPDQLLRYGELRMDPPSSSQRGRLRVAARTEIYLQLLVAQEIEVEFDVLGAVARAEREAGRLVDDSLPSGCRYAWSKEYDYAYAAGSRVDIPSDGSFHAVPLDGAEATVSRRYVVVPRESADVFRTASLDNPLDAPLLPGPVDVYMSGDFLMTTEVDFTPARGKLTLGLGVEQGIKVARNTRYREETAGLIGGALELTHQIIVDIRNNLDRPAPMEVRERVPVVRKDDEDDIKLTVHNVSPAWERYEQTAKAASERELEGGYRWRLEVPAGGAESLRAEYEIRISSKHELVGGNRRES